MKRKRDYLRGWPIYFDEQKNEYLFEDTLESTKETFMKRPCGVCKAYIGEGPDPCLGWLPGVKNACCGHGIPRRSYIQFENGVIIRGFKTIENAEKQDGIKYFEIKGVQIGQSETTK